MEDALSKLSQANSSDFNVNSDYSRWLGVRQGDQVTVTPEDTGHIPTIGELIGLDDEEVVIRAAKQPGSPVTIHFPRLGFIIEPAGITPKGYYTFP
jgi:hypothetical protein